MSEYCPNIWNHYDRSKSEDANNRNGSVITPEKLRHMEEGIRLANRPIEVGVVRTLPPDSPAAIRMDENDTKIIVDVDIPQGKVDDELLQSKIDSAKEEIASVSSSVLTMFHGQARPDYGLTDIVLVLEPEASDITEFTAAEISNLLFGDDLPTIGSSENFGIVDNKESDIMLTSLDTEQIDDNILFVSNLVSGKLTVNTEPKPDTTFFADVDDEENLQ